MSNKTIVQELVGNGATVLNHVRGNMKTGRAIWKVELQHNGEMVERWMTIGQHEGELIVMSTDPIPTKKAAKKAEPTIVDGGVLRIGRNYLPTRTWSDGRVERNRKVDGTGEWVTVPA